MTGKGQAAQRVMPTYLGKEDVVGKVVPGHQAGTVNINAGKDLAKLPNQLPRLGPRFKVIVALKPAAVANAGLRLASHLMDRPDLGPARH